MKQEIRLLFGLTVSLLLCLPTAIYGQIDADDNPYSQDMELEISAWRYPANSRWRLYD